MCCTKKYDEPNIVWTDVLHQKIWRTKYNMNRCIAPKNMTNQIFILRTDVLHQKYDEPNDVCMLWTDLMHQKMRWTNYVYYEQMFCNKKIWWIKILWTDVLHLKLQSCTFFSKFANFATFAQFAQVCLFCTISSTFAQVFKFAQSAQLSIFALFSCPEQLNRTHCPSGTTKGTFTFDITDWP